MFDIRRRKKIKKENTVRQLVKKKENNTTKKKQKTFVGFGFGEEKNNFIDNFTMLLGSGMNVLLALDAVESEMKTKKMKAAIGEIKEEIKDGSSLWRALKGTGFLPDHVISLLRIGEESGKLAENLVVIAKQQEKEKIFKSKIRSAMMYPALIVSLTVIIGIGIAWFILPRLASVFDNLKLELPVLTRALVATGKFLAVHGALVIPAIVVVILTIAYFVFSFSKTKFIGQAILIRIPIVKTLIRQVELSRFGYILGTLLEAGMPVTKSLESLGRSSTFKLYSNFYKEIEMGITEGKSFGKIFASNSNSRKIIPVTVQQMIISGEQSGNLSKTLLKIGDIHEAKTENTTKNLSVVLEPLLLVVVWIGVVFVALAVIMPIYSLIGGLKGGGSSASSSVSGEKTIEIKAEEQKMELEIIGQQEKEIKEEVVLKLRILETGVDYLNVRDIPSTNGKVVKKVSPGDEFVYVGDENGWYKIVLSSVKSILEESKDNLVPDDSDDLEANDSDVNIQAGWVVGTYIEVIE